jgi:hypothetical protein
MNHARIECKVQIDFPTPNYESFQKPEYSNPHSLARNSLARVLPPSEFWQIRLQVTRILANPATGDPNFGKSGYR